MQQGRREREVKGRAVILERLLKEGPSWNFSKLQEGRREWRECEEVVREADIVGRYSWSRCTDIVRQADIVVRKSSEKQLVVGRDVQGEVKVVGRPSLQSG